MRRTVAVLTLLVLLGACGSEPDSNEGIASAGGDGTGSPSTSTSPAGTTEEQSQKFAKCMRDNGINVPDPGPDGFGDWDRSELDPASPAFRKAMEACQSVLPGGRDLSATDPELIDQLRRLTQCLRDNGIDVPDPDPDSPSLGMGEMLTIDRNSPAFQKAMEACRGKMPEGRGR